MAEAADADPAAYASFNDFFTRALKPGARPLAQADWCARWTAPSANWAPLKATRSSRPRATSYSTTALVGGDAALAAHFHGGQFATIYLSPKDYHRIHMPCAGRLLRMVHVPGDAVFGQSGHGAWCAGAVCTQRTGGVCV
jgi:phosphatidylserine decarboxylase